MTLEVARRQANVNERSKHLFAQGYRAKVVDEYTVEVRNPDRVVYKVNPIEETCTCPFFTSNSSEPCKHLLGWKQLIQDWFSANLGIQAKFCPGMVVCTAGANAALAVAGDHYLPYLKRHLTGDWGNLGNEDRASNEYAMDYGGRMISAYRLSDGTRIWVISEANRMFCTFLTPEEY